MNIRANYIRQKRPLTTSKNYLLLFLNVETLSRQYPSKLLGIEQLVQRGPLPQLVKVQPDVVRKMRGQLAPGRLCIRQDEPLDAVAQGESGLEEVEADGLDAADDQEVGGHEQGADVGLGYLVRVGNESVGTYVNSYYQSWEKGDLEKQKRWLKA